MTVTVSYSLDQLGNTEFFSFTASAHSDVVGLGNGGFAVTAEFTADGLSALIAYDSLGNPSVPLTAESLDPAVARLANGDIVQVGATASGLVAIIADSAGNLLGSGGVSFAGGTRADVAGLKDGSNNFVVVNETQISATERDITVTLCNGIGFIRSFEVDPGAFDDRAPSVAALDDGGFAVAWERHAGGETEVWSAVYDADGSVRAAPVLVDGFGTINEHASVTALRSGGFAIAYADNGWDGEQTDVTVALFSASGVFFDFLQGSSLTADDGEPAATTLSNGLVLTSFTSSGDIRASVFDPADGKVVTDIANPLSITARGDSETEPSVSGLDLAQFVTTYTTGGLIAEAVFQLVRTRAGDAADDVLIGDEARDLMFGGEGNDILAAAANNDLLDGGGGDDTMTGGAGNDEYGVDSTGDVVIEARNGGEDLVRSTVTLTLGANFEILVLGGAAAIDGTGNGLANRIEGNGAANVLNGGRGADFMAGDDGSDTYMVDNLGDQIFEAFGDSLGGIDLVLSSATHTLEANLENMRLTGSAAATGTGNERDNVLTGNGAANRLFGLLGADTISGGGGNDTIDGGDQDDELSGDAGDDTLAGKAGDDTLDGGAGNDTMRGGLGNDVYLVDAAGDTVSEAGGDGIDTVRSTVSFILGSGVEDLELVTSQAVNGTGNNLANTLTGGAGANVLSGLGGDDTLIGNSGSDTLDGGTGADLMFGHAGNDLYSVDNAGDVVSETASSGTDTVQSSLAAYTLGANVEDLLLAGIGDAAGTGNGMANLLTGNGGANALDGAEGKDTIDGRAGADVLTGGAGSDVFVFEAAQADGDTVVDFAGNGASAGDSLRFVGYGTFEDGARLIQLSATKWLAISSGGGIQDVLTFSNAAAIHASDVVFL